MVFGDGCAIGNSDARGHGKQWGRGSGILAVGGTSRKGSESTDGRIGCGGYYA